VTNERHLNMAKILIIDDRAVNREFLVTLLSYKGHRLLEAGDGAEGLAVARAEHPDLVICDVLMPTMDGYEFVRQLREDPAIAHITVIFYTAHYREREAQKLAEACGVSYVLTKPCEPELVIRVVEEALGHPSSPASTMQPKTFDREHLRLVTDKLSQTAEELQAANEHLTALIDFNLHLASERDPLHLLDEVGRGARELIGAKYGCLGVRDKNDDKTAYFVTSGISADIAAKLEQPPLEKGILGAVITERKSRRLFKLDRDPEILGLPAGYPPVHSFLAAPVASLKYVYGWICLTNKMGADEFSDEDEQLLTILAAQVGRIYENGSLYVEVQRHLENLEKEIVERKHAERDLHEVKERLDSILSSLQDVVWSISATTHAPIYLNPATQDVYGRPPDEFFSNPDLWHQIIYPDDRERVFKYSREIAAGKAAEIEYRIMHLDGTVRWVHDRGRLVRDQNGVAVRIDGLTTDITVRKEHEARVIRLNRIYAVLSGINTAIVRIHDQQKLFEEACRIAVEHGNFRMAWIGALPPGANVVAPLAWAGYEDGYLKKICVTTLENEPGSSSAGSQALRQKKPVVCNAIARDTKLAPWTKDALERGYQSLACFPLVVGDEAKGILALYASEADFFDEEEMKLLTELASDISFALLYIEKEEKINYLAYYDSVTGLANRVLCFDRLNQQLAAVRSKASQTALVLVDIERFRTINDTLGRDAGDVLLKQLGERLSESFQGSTGPARIGTNCFAVTISNVRKETEIIEKIEQNVFHVLSLPFKIGAEELRISVKVGIAVSPHDGQDAETLFRNAEPALIRAKRSGESYLFYAPEMNARVAEKLALENKLRIALEKQQFVLHYQPKVNLSDKQVSGLEALIRWQDPDTGLVPPLKFIPLLEETGMILDVGYWVIRQALADLKRWAAKDVHLRIAVNVSPIQLRRKDFIDRVKQAIVGYEAYAQSLDVEITESLIMENIEDNIGKLKALREMGINVAIDDFGTGYSSLGYLAKLPVNALKIDRSFIVKMVQEPDSMTIVSTIISLAHSLHLIVIAEGVELEEQSKFLALLKCDEIQGYLLSRPLPVKDMDVFLAARSAAPKAGKSV
jgi:diguanylate cyclase (GGDEF)-like protein/PAS domain S-box-containing protein